MAQAILAQARVAAASAAASGMVPVVVPVPAGPPQRGWGASDGLLALVEAAVPLEVRAALRGHLLAGCVCSSAGGDDGSGDEALASTLRALAQPPKTVSLRLTSAAAAQAEDSCDGSARGAVEAALSSHTASLREGADAPAHTPTADRSMGGGAGATFAVRSVADLPAPMCWLACPEALIVVANRDEEQCFAAETIDETADVVIDAACAMAVLRGADVFCGGVMAASPSLAKGQAVQLWVVPEGTRPPTRGTLLGAAGASLDPLAVLVAGAQAVLDRAAIFAQGACGIALAVLWRSGSRMPLAPMNGVLNDRVLQGRVILQQLPSCMAARLLAPGPGDHVLDMCAAPGGKTTHLAQLLGKHGEGLVAVDRSLTKVRRVESLCSRYGFRAVRCVAADSRHICHDAIADARRNIGCAQGGTVDPHVEHRDTDSDSVSGIAPSATSFLPVATAGEPWPPEAECAIRNALAAHGADRFRSHKRIWKAVVGAVGRGAVSRLQVQTRLRQLAGSGPGAAADGSDPTGGALSAEATTTVQQRQHQPQQTPRLAAKLRSREPGEAAISFPPSSFDCVLLDAPCSAMGQRPLLRWGKTMAEVRDHAEYQRQFLRTAAQLLRPGGHLVYSTCTLMPEENEENVRWALDALPLDLEDARKHALVAGHRPEAARALAGLAGCGLGEDERLAVLRFDPREWDVGFFIARFRRRL